MNKRYFNTGGLTLEINSDIPMTPDTFHPKFNQFETDGPGKENIVVQHFFNKSLEVNVSESKKIYNKKPWSIYEKNDRLIYQWITDGTEDIPNLTFYRKIIANKTHTKIDIFHDAYFAAIFEKGNLEEISLLPTDQLLLSRILGFHHGCLIHSSGLIYNDKGFLFVGHSRAGKTTITNIMKPEAIVLHDDRNIIRKTDNGYRLYGTWRHTKLEENSSRSIPLKAIFILKQSKKNQIVPITDRKQCFYLLMDHLVTSLITHDWMEATMDLIENISKKINIYHLYFDKTGSIKNLIDKI